MHRPVLFVVMITALCAIVIQQRLAAQAQRQMPILQVDPYWPQLPENWIIGVGAGVAADAENMAIRAKPEVSSLLCNRIVPLHDSIVPIRLGYVATLSRL